MDQSIQLKIIDELGFHLSQDGKMIFVESSEISQRNINEQRTKYNLPEIKPPFYNLFLNDDILLSYDFKNVELIEIDPFASNFYYLTRVIYARYCKEFIKELPSYDHPLNHIAISMEGNLYKKDFSQVKTFIFRKKI